MRMLSTVAMTIGCVVMNTAFLGASSADEGAKLYKFHGCANCHGEGGEKPVADIFPKLTGKESAYLVEQMDAILSGKRTSGNAAIMHKTFYHPQEAAAKCDVAPSKQELQAIADWLASR